MSDYVPSQFHSYVKLGDFRTCDECGVTQRAGDVERVQLHGAPHDRCRDKGRCARFHAELTKAKR